MSLCTPKLPRIIVSKGNHMSQDTIIRRSPIRGSGRICKFYPSLAPLHEGSFGPLHTQRGLLKPHFGNAKDGSNGTFGVPYRSDFRFGRRRPLFFIACESLFGSRVVFSRTDHLQGFFQDFIASGTQTFDPGMHRYVDPHTRRTGVRIVRIINSETEST